jgi:glutaredoxin-related protein
LKRFLKIRDTSSLYDPIRGTGRVGIPTVLLDGEVTLGLDEDQIEELLK